jgi:hypothetical protein
MLVGVTENREDLYRKIRNLLAKAEGTTNEHEADAFFKKAQELIMRYAVEEQALWAKDPSKREQIDTLKIKIEDRKVGSDEKRSILNACARNNRCRMWYMPGFSTSTIAGFGSDILFVEMLYKSIVTQMNFQMVMAEAMTPGIHPKTFRVSFQAGFAAQIWNRLKELSKQNTDTLKSEGSGMELVLLSRDEQVGRWVDENMNLGRGSVTEKRINNTAYASGREAANRVDVSGGRNQFKGGAKQLGR